MVRSRAILCYYAPRLIMIYKRNLQKIEKKTIYSAIQQSMRVTGFLVFVSDCHFEESLYQ